MSEENFHNHQFNETKTKDFVELDPISSSTIEKRLNLESEYHDEIGKYIEIYPDYFSESEDNNELNIHILNSLHKQKKDPALDICINSIEICNEVIKQKATCIYSWNKSKLGEILPDHWELANPRLFWLTRSFLVALSQLNSPINLRCEQYDAVIEAYNQVLRPYKDCIYDLLKHPYDQLKVVNPESKFVHKTTSIAAISNHFIKVLFEQLDSPAYIKRANDRRKVARRREKKVLKYIAKLRKQHSRLLGVRVDLYLPADKKHFTSQEIVEHFHPILQKLRRSKSLHLAGYVWKLEYGVDQALHIHCFFFFNGKHHREDISLGRMIGEMWDSQIGGKHSYFNCNTSKNRKKYKYDALGEIKRDDQSKYDNISKVIHYFAKFEQYVLHSSLERVKTLNTGLLPQVKKGMGRPNLTQYYKSI